MTENQSWKKNFKADNKEIPLFVRVNAQTPSFLETKSKLATIDMFCLGDKGPRKVFFCLVCPDFLRGVKCIVETLGSVIFLWRVLSHLSSQIR